MILLVLQIRGEETVAHLDDDEVDTESRMQEKLEVESQGHTSSGISNHYLPDGVSFGTRIPIPILRTGKGMKQGINKRC